MKQEKLRLLPKGVYKTKDGHLRYSSPKELRGEYVHREVIKKAIEETPYSIKLLLPWPYEVHHLDFNKEHNDRSNLLICSESFHSALTARSATNNFHVKYKPPPDYVLFKEDEIDEVPF